MIRRCSGPRAPRDVSDVDDEDENPSDAGHHRRPGSTFRPVLYINRHCITANAYTAAAVSSPWRKEYTVIPPACLIVKSLNFWETSPKAIIRWSNAYSLKRTSRAAMTCMLCS